ncbi:hypothetical protein GNIT_2716 [Glaciecola nitratireducens FR1064]|uniref:Uncharacterized protein n=1 Tax=Glaciecola nitratireducens (strain JCM 12485 / KCTC 12276 / FR1064) TaxID=1085623 RepID=G4QMP2_GLANF|nr:hypothetical protein GNIT_2716 [Glaciecola nitratireducens FR1064]
MPNRRTLHDGMDTYGANPANSSCMPGTLIFSQGSVRRNAHTRNASVVFNLVYAIMTKM